MESNNLFKNNNNNKEFDGKLAMTKFAKRLPEIRHKHKYIKNTIEDLNLIEVKKRAIFGIARFVKLLMVTLLNGKWEKLWRDATC